VLPQQLGTNKSEKQFNLTAIAGQRLKRLSQSYGVTSKSRYAHNDKRKQMKRWLKFGKRVIFWSCLTIVLKKFYSDVARFLGQHIPAGYVFPRFREKWRSLPAFTRKLIGNMIVGLSILLLLTGLHDTPFHSDMQDAALDWMMKMYSGTPPKKHTPPFAFLDIDETTYRSWGEPYISPRNKVLELLKFALSGNPEAVVVDIDLSRRAGKGDEALAEYFRHYPAARPPENKRQQDNPPIFLSRVFRPLKDAAKGIDYEFMPSFLDQAVTSSPLVYWTSPLFDIDEDFVIRGWRPWEITCDRNTVTITPSVQLLVYLQLNAHQSLAHFIDEIRRQLTETNANQCNGTMITNAGMQAGGESESPDDMTFKIGELELHRRSTNLSRRFIYEVPWKLEPNETRPVVEYQGKVAPILSTRSAGVITQQSDMVDSSWLAGHIVIIGGSYSEGRDIFPTPIGQMPGAMVLVNAIHSLLQYGVLSPPPMWIMLLVQSLLILLISIIFSRFDSFWGLLVSGGMVILLLLPVSFWIFRYGIWVDFALPLLAVQFHHMAMEFREDGT